MKIIKNPGKLLSDLLLYDSFSQQAHIAGIENDAGATRIYVVSDEAICAGVVTRHYIRTEELVLDDVPGLRELLGIPKEKSAKEIFKLLTLVKPPTRDL